MLDMKPYRIDLGLPRLLYLFKLLALCQTGVSSLCWKFSLCAGQWHCLQKQVHFPPKIELSKTGLCFAWLKNVSFFGLPLVLITGKNLNQHLIYISLFEPYLSSTVHKLSIKTIIKITTVITVVWEISMHQRLLGRVRLPAPKAFQHIKQPSFTDHTLL